MSATRPSFLIISLHVSGDFNRQKEWTKGFCLGFPSGSRSCSSVVLVLGTGEALGLSVYFSQRSSMHFALSWIVHCNSFGCNSNVGARYFIFSPDLGGFCLSLGGFTGRGFIQVGAFMGCPPGAGPLGLGVAVAPSLGAVEGTLAESSKHFMT